MFWGCIAARGRGIVVYASELHHQGIDLLGHHERKIADMDATSELQYSSVR